MGAVRSDGTLWTWGLNDEGQLGLGNTTNYSSPVQVGSLTSWESFHSLQLSSGAIKTDGTLWTWGRNHQGQQGHGNTTDSSSPVQVGSLTNWGGGQVRTTPGNTWRAIKTDGTLWFWGYDGRGMSGNGSTTGSSSPVQTGSLTNWYNGSFADGYRNMGTGKQDRVVVKSDGTLWSWGRNQFGQHGVGDTTGRSTPNQVGSETIWFNAGGGTYMSAALKDVS